jgi:hypothetical protein
MELEMTSSLEQITAELATIFRRFSYEPEAGFFDGTLAALHATSSFPEGQKEVARDILSAYRGMGSLNDVVIMFEGTADIEANDHVAKLLRELRAVAIDVATGSDA